MNAWAQRHRAALEAALEDGERLKGADRVIAAGRHGRRRDLPSGGFVLLVTDRRLVALAASRWRAYPGDSIASWPYAAGYALGVSSRWAFGRIHLVLPDRTVVSLRPYGGRGLAHLVDT